MPLKLNFSKVVIPSFTRTAAGGTIKVQCAPTKTVAKAMGWDDCPEWLKTCTPVGQLAASIVEFVPNDSTLSKHEIALDASLVYSFALERKQVKKGKAANKSKTYRVVLACSVDFTSNDGAKKLEQYIQAVPESTMRVTYEKEAEQEELPMQSEDGRQATLAEAD